MRHVAAYLMLALTGNDSPSAEDVKTLLSSVGIEPVQEHLEKLISEVQGKDLAQLIEEGSAKLSAVPTGGAATSASAPAGAAAAEEAAPAEEEEPESDSGSEGGGMGLFGDDDDEDSD